MSEQPAKRRSRFWRWLRIVLAVVVLVILVPYVLTVLYRFANPVSTPMLWRWATGAPVARTWMPIGRLSPQLPRAVIVAEDARFCAHRGVDFGQIVEAINEADDLSEARGGSTITQQTAKNLFLWSSRSFVRKGLELPLALWMDLVLGKERILEIYLNIAEWGPNGEFGAEAGARRAFGKSAANLTAGEAAALAAMLPNPRQRNIRAPVVRRLSSIYVGRMMRSGDLDRCVLSP
jgi:monofunctional biosynthetic peptidoglycan transglycosylase